MFEYFSNAGLGLNGRELMSLAVLATYLFFTLVVLLIGFRIMFLPLRLGRKAARGAIREISQPAALLTILWAVVLVPEPFIYLWNWFVSLGKAIIFNVPTIAAKFAINIYNCDSPLQCAAESSNLISQLWQDTLRSSLNDFQFPPGLDRAALAFMIVATIAVMIGGSKTETTGRPIFGASRDKVAAFIGLSVAFIFAAYLAFIAIVAVPVFDQKAPDLTEMAKELETRLDETSKQFDINFAELPFLQHERSALPTKEAFAAELSLKAGQNKTPDFVTSIWETQLLSWDRDYENLLAAAAAMPARSSEFIRNAKLFFQVNNEGHIGEMLSRRHVSRITAEFSDWQNDYRSNVLSCYSALRYTLGTLRVIRSNLQSVALDPIASRPSIDLPSSGSCSYLQPSIQGFLPQRSALAQSLGPFGAAAAWLLQTENQELALITGLLGFGFFGALAASFIRQYANRRDAEFPSLSFVIPAFIRGIGAAVLVFLLAKGGTAVFTKGDAPLNAYAIFFACFVAAVFSEDVWIWARKRQQTSMDTSEYGETGQKGADKRQKARPDDSRPAEAAEEEQRRKSAQLKQLEDDWGV
ncbi:hypothetical protein [Neorhizobium alkalisoli]|uniref:Uncharacterized protein n=1 Tax=Neorhizobium alkalisoli TaxID=528178 RepID=A0A561QNU0_9HYPH|nr:hypothetical protein [Neorhizobium alkalisoli]TWF52085.1 hypothetical protein FHW37_105184 [Neorhizobium alkalisoli]